jgi:hypothetical protein
MSLIFSLLAGVIFGAGLTLSDMVNPARVLNFLDVAGSWDPTLIFVMAGGLAVTTLGYRLIFAVTLPCSATNSICQLSDRLTYPLSGAPRCLAWGGALLASAPARPSPIL